MSKKIEVFIKNREILTQFEVSVDHSCWHGTAREIGSKVERVLPEDDKHLLDIVRTVAKEKGLKVEVYNLSTWGGRLRARFKDIQKTPAIIVDNKRISERVTKRNLLAALE